MDWLRERNNDPCGTPNRHPFWATVDAEDRGDYRIFKRDGNWYAYDRRCNAWYGFREFAEVLAHTASGVGTDVWA